MVITMVITMVIIMVIIMMIIMVITIVITMIIIIIRCTGGSAIVPGEKAMLMTKRSPTRVAARVRCRALFKMNMKQE